MLHHPWKLKRTPPSSFHFTRFDRTGITYQPPPERVLERVREGQRSQSPLLSFHRLPELPVGETAADSDENICRFYLERRVRPKQLIQANRLVEASQTRSRLLHH